MSLLRALTWELTGRSLQGLDLSSLTDEQRGWLGAGDGLHPGAVDWLVRRVEQDASREAAEVLWLAARDGHPLHAAAPALGAWRHHDDPHVRYLACLALACIGDEAVRSEVLAEVRAAGEADRPPIGATRYSGVRRTWVSFDGHEPRVPDPGQTHRCAACRAPKAVLVWQDLWGDNSGRQETREYRCPECGLFTTEYVDD